MEKSQRWKENLVTALEIPGDLANRDTVLTVMGKNSAVIENYRCILKYTREEIIIQTFCGKLKLMGKRLEIPYYSSDEMKVKGYISGVFLES